MPIAGKGAWSARGGGAALSLDLAASSLTQRFADMVGPSGCKATHVTCIYRGVGGPHDFDMQSSGGLSGANYSKAVNGLLMSFLIVLRSLTEQVARGVGLMIKVSALH